MEEIPEDLRCKRSDGKQWRCSALSMPDKTVCEKHYIQAKKRAANSALRASLKKARRGALDNSETYLQSKRGGPEMSRSMSPVNGMEHRNSEEKFGRSQGLCQSDMMGPKGSTARGGLLKYNEGQRDATRSDDDRLRSAYDNLYLNKDEYHGKSSDSGEAEGLTCHQCRRNNRTNIVWCTSCDRKGYCGNCISQWYADIPVDDVRKICPACRGICNCKVCLRGDNLIKTKVQEISNIDKLRYFHSLLSSILPVLKHIYAEQCLEIALERRIHGMKTDIPRAIIQADEQMCCNLCKIPIYDFHRHCPQCFYDLCLSCCRDIGKASLVSVSGESDAEKMTAEKLMLFTNDETVIDFSYLFPKWKANPDGSIPCAPEEVGGCCSSKLILRRILKINWVAKLVKNAEEIVTGCKVSDVQISDSCPCTVRTSSQTSDSNESLLNCSSHRDSSDENILYAPTYEDLKHEGINHFHKHWVQGEPVMVKDIFDHSLASSWDPMSIWRGIQETVDENTPENNTIVKVVDYFSQSEVDIELSQFLKGYSQGLTHDDGRPKMLILRDWPPPSAWEEFILCQRPEFLTNLPLVEFIHSKWGLLNLAAKLPHDSIQSEAGPKIYISYGTCNELGRGDPATKLRINMGDMVYLLMHSSEADSQSSQIPGSDKTQTSYKESGGMQAIQTACLSDSGLHIDEKIESSNLLLEQHAEENISGLGFNMNDDRVCNSTATNLSEKKSVTSSCLNNDSGDARRKSSAGAIWDVFRRQDVPKLNEYLRVHQEEFTAGQLVTHPVYDQNLYLDKHQKRKLKEEQGIEPWTFQQHLGEAVFIPAGCPFQVRNLQSTVQLGLDFLSPESLKESVKMAQQIRCLPEDHSAKLNMWEVGKMCLYAASSAIREIHRIVLDSELSSDINFEDQNLTSMVSENLGRMMKRRQVACS